MAIVHSQNTAFHTEYHTCNKAVAHEKMAHARDLAIVEDLSFDLKYYRFEWQIDPAVYAIAGTATCYFETQTAAFDHLNFNLSTQLTVSSVKYHGTNLVFSQTGDYGLTVNLPAALAQGTLDSLSITYQGIPPSGGFGSFIQSAHGGTPILWTLSEPFGAQDWWPCKNGLTDKVDSVDILVTTPEQYRVASNGVLTAETNVAGGFKQYHWKHRYAIAPYLVAVAVTNFAQYTDIVPLSNGTQMPMLNYVYPENLSEAQNGTADLVQVLQYFDSLFVTYPFYQEKYGHAQFGWGGGMEHQTMSFVINYSWGLLAHELAHQWFGDMVTCGSWEDIWLNEGFATFLEGLSRERFLSEAEWLNWRQSRVGNITSQPGGSVRVDDTTSVNRIFNGRLSYSKGAYLLHMLRWKLGNDAFFQGVRNYLNDRKFNFARTPQLKAHLEAASGQNLDAFFADWFAGQGFPSYQLIWSQSNTNQISVQLAQTTSSSAVSFFEMPVPVRFSGQGQDTILRFEHSFSGQSFTAQLPFTVSSVAIDPDLWLISANNTVQKVSGTTDLPAELTAFQVIPNPANGRFVATLEANTAEEVNCSLVNAVGQTIVQRREPMQRGTNLFHFTLADFPAGTYTLHVRGKDWQTQKTVIKTQ